MRNRLLGLALFLTFGCIIIPALIPLGSFLDARTAIKSHARKKDGFFVCWGQKVWGWADLWCQVLSCTLTAVLTGKMRTLSTGDK